MKHKHMVGLLIFFIVLSLIGVAATLFAQEVVFYNTNQATISWDAVTVDADGDAFPEGTIVSYKLLIVNAATDPNKTNPVILTPITTTFQTITLTKGRYFVGVQACIEGDVCSEINWADNPDFQTVPPFGLKYLIAPAVPIGLRR
jgi:hypothetical protein